MAYEKLLEKIESNKDLSKEEIIELLEIENYSEHYYKLLYIANKLSRTEYKKIGYIFAQIGLNSEPCSGNCKFCSLGKDYFSTEEILAKSEEEILNSIQNLANSSIHRLFLMTTADYDFDKFISIGEKARNILPDRIKLVANIGDFDLKSGLRLKEAGFSGAYHICRLNEGIDTDIDPKKRVETIEVIKKVGLDLYYCVEPIGPEHTYEQISDEIIRARNYDVKYMAVMRRIPVENTTLYEKGMITSAELLKIAAVTRIACKPSLSMNAHETVSGFYLAGINQIYAEYGANPRDVSINTEKSRGMSIQQAEKLLNDAGYTI